jgi:hypothetical protein
MNTITDHSVAHVLHGAELTLTWRGWGQGSLVDDDCWAVCLAGAVIVATAGSIDPWCNASLSDDDEALIDAACRMLRVAIGEHERDADSWADASIYDIEIWNDKPGRALDEVLAVLRRAQILAGGTS